jgi:hypothetical protein
MTTASEAAFVARRRHGLAALASEVDVDARSWGLSPAASMALVAAPVALVAVTAASLASRPVFRALTREDGPIEWAQFVLFGAGAAGAVLVARRLRHRHLATWALLYLLAASGLFFVAGEEISWGQRVLGFETPEQLEEINSQGESTVHNVGRAQEVFKAGEFAAALYGAMMPLVMRSRFRPRSGPARHFAALSVPPLALAPLFLVMAGYRMARYTVMPKTWVTVEAAETAELCLALGIAAFVLLLASRLRREVPDDRGCWRTGESRFATALGVPPRSGPFS